MSLDDHLPEVVMVGLVGRAEELARLAATVAAPPSVAVVAGEAGVGKTRLVTELRERVRAAGGWFAVGRCRPVREPFPLGPVLEVLRDGSVLPAGTAVSPVVGALRPLLPEIADRLPVLPAPLGDRLDERHRVFRAVAELLAVAGAATVVLEDLHWADEQTVDLLGYLLRDPPPRLALVLTYREDEVDPRLRAVAATAAGEVTRTHLALVPLDAEQTGALAAAVLGEPRVSEEFAVHLWERTGGLPFAVEEVLALLRERGTLVRRDGRWQRQVLAELDVPSGIREPVRERLGRLPDVARAVAEAAAVVQVPVPIEVLIGTSRTDPARARQGLEQALEAGLLVEPAGGTGDGVGLRHLLAAQAVYDEIPLPRRQELHARAADALRALRPVPLGQVAHHLRRAGRVSEWVAAAEQAADQAAELGHHDEAARLLEDVLRGAVLDAEQQGWLAAKLGVAAASALHRSKGVADLLRGALDQPLPARMRGELLLRLAILQETMGIKLEVLQELFQEAVEGLADVPELQAVAMVGLAFPLVPGVPASKHRRWWDRIVATLPRVDDGSRRMHLLSKVAMVQVTLGDAEWRVHEWTVVAQTGGAARGLQEVGAYQSIGIAACLAGHHAEADRLLRAAAAGSAAAGARSREVWIRANLVLLDYFRGSWEGLAERVGAVIDELADHPSKRSCAEVVAGCLALARGEPDPAARRLDQVMDALWTPTQLDLLAVAVAARLRLAVVRDETGEAGRLARALVGAVESVPLQVAAFWALPAVVEALVVAGSREEAAGWRRAGSRRWADGTRRWRRRRWRTPGGCWPRRPAGGRRRPASCERRRRRTTGWCAHMRRRRRGSGRPGRWRARASRPPAS